VVLFKVRKIVPWFLVVLFKVRKTITWFLVALFRVWKTVPWFLVVGLCGYKSNIYKNLTNLVFFTPSGSSLPAKACRRA
jgi:hypothetical protein